ncbi:hypothetical protein BGX28_000787 [Mortierella sp. GBA30]|nr:hypothetical protein BGX28_000787 [Mortierella sp. GBA30]
MVLSAASTAFGYNAGQAVDTARHALGLPYVWGGGHGPHPGSTRGGFDCSGLTRYAISGGGGGDVGAGSARSQLNSANLRSINANMRQAGDLVFYGSPPYHVAFYIGNNRMIEAAHQGVPVRETVLRPGTFWRRVK